MNNKPKILIFASGAKEGGGSGFENLIRESKNLNYEVVAVVSNHENGGVKEKAHRLGIQFIYFNGPFKASEYQRILKESNAEWIALSGWLKLVLGLDPKKTINIHPGPLPQFGGKGMYGPHVHEAVIESGVKHSAVTMHFVTEKYDEGPVFFRFPIEVKDRDTPEILGKRVNDMEHKWQPIITEMVVNGGISWDGKDPKSLKVPKGYKYL